MWAGCFGRLDVWSVGRWAKLSGTDSEEARELGNENIETVTVAAERASHRILLGISVVSVQCGAVSSKQECEGGCRFLCALSL